MRTLMIVTAALVLAGCVTCRCAPCGPAITLNIRGADGTVPRDVTIAGGGGFACVADLSAVTCTSEVPHLGSQALIIRSAGNEDLALSVLVEDDADGCCQCGYAPIVRDLLVGAGDAGAPRDL